MARITLDGIAHSYASRPSGPGDFALHRLDHTWEDGGAYALLGPSGCGKTTLLNVISGLVQPTEGRVLFDGADVTALPTEKRNIAQVFQFPVVYDTMTVYDNLAFPLRNRGVDEGRIKARVAEVAEMLELTADLDRRARGLGADGKQKISLGRGLMRDDVAAILLDEPLTVIDPHLKWQLRRKLKQIHERYRLTLIYVTHDQNEALTFADQVAVMLEGRILQLGTPQELFEAPRHTFVGFFIGSPGMNLLPCRIEDNAAVVDGARIPLEPGRAAAKGDGARIEIGIRPEFLGVSAAESPGAVRGRVTEIEEFGDFRIVTVALGPHRLKAKLAEDAPPPSETAYLTFPPEWTRLYADGRLIE